MTNNVSLYDLSEDLRYNAIDLLEKIESETNGEQDSKFVPFNTIWQDILKTRPQPPLSKEEYNHKLIPALLNSNAIECNNNNEIAITFEGICILSNFLKLPLEKYGFLSSAELQNESLIVSNYFKGKGVKPTSEMIYEEFKDKVGHKNIKQIIDYLTRKN